MRVLCALSHAAAAMQVHACKCDRPPTRPTQVHRGNIYVDTGFFHKPSARYGDGYGLAVGDLPQGRFI